MLTFTSSPLASVCLVVFFVVGSRVTRVGGARKLAIDPEYRKGALAPPPVRGRASRSLTPAALPGGARRNWKQVLANSTAANVACALLLADEMRVAWGRGSGGARRRHAARHAEHGVRRVGTVAARRSAGGRRRVRWLCCCACVRVRMMLTRASRRHYACCCGDTMASELGVLSPGRPRMVIAPWRAVPPGTNGGVSIGGLLASAAGGAVIGAVSVVATLAWPTDASSPYVGIFVLGVLAGVLGSLFDSLLGALLQFTGTDEKGRAVNAPRAGVRHIAGIDVLSNDAVNLLSSAAMALASPWLLGIIITV